LKEQFSKVLGKKMETVRKGNICYTIIQIGPLVEVA
jgi:hypothetical protein